jgi:hypothetical protein
VATTKSKKFSWVDLLGGKKKSKKGKQGKKGGGLPNMTWRDYVQPKRR